MRDLSWTWWLRLNLFSSKSKCIAVGGLICRVTIMCTSLLFFPFMNQSILGTDSHIKVGQFVQLTYIFYIRYNENILSWCLVLVAWWMRAGSGPRCWDVIVTMWHSVVTPRSAQQSPLSIISGPLTTDPWPQTLQPSADRWALGGPGAGAHLLLLRCRVSVYNSR